MELENWKYFSQRFQVKVKRRGIPGLFDRMRRFFTGKDYMAVEYIEINFGYLGDADPVDVMLAGMFIHKYDKDKLIKRNIDDGKSES